MGVVCNCAKAQSQVEAFGHGAVIQKPPTILVTTVDPSMGVETVKQELNAYLDDHKQEMNTKLVRVFLAAAKSPEKGLDSLKLKLCSMRDTDWTHFSSLFGYGRFITKLLLWKISLSSIGFAHVCASLEALKSLKELTLGDIGLGHHDIAIFATALRGATNLTLLALTVDDLCSDQISLICSAMHSLPSLEDLNLDENQISDTGCLAVSLALPFLPALKLLSLRYNGITHIGCGLLLKTAVSKKGLKVLMEGNDIWEEDLERLRVVEDE